MEQPERSPAFVALLVVGATAVPFPVFASPLTIPLYALARFTGPGRGTGREWFREGLRWAVAAGAGLAWWLRRGGRLPEAPEPWEVE